MDRPAVILDDARAEGSKALSFARPQRVIVAEHPTEVGVALDAVDAALADGKYVAGYLSYEAGYPLEPRLTPLLPADRKVPLLWFGVFDAPITTSGDLPFIRPQVSGRAYAGPLQHQWNEAEYARRFHRVHDFIVAGDVYQVNLTFRSRFCFCGDPLALYLSLRVAAAAAHCAYIDDGERQILSLSPELFFATSAERRITAKPMKGTTPRGDNPAGDLVAIAALRASEKERAENLMIVDLLRNDLGRIAEIGSVAVEKLFAVETYPTLHHMVLLSLQDFQRTFALQTSCGLYSPVVRSSARRKSARWSSSVSSKQALVVRIAGR